MGPKFRDSWPKPRKYPTGKPIGGGKKPTQGKEPDTGGK